MATRTQTTLTEETIDQLQTLIRANIDSVKGFEEAADEVEDGRIAGVFRELAAERSEFANDLKQRVAQSGCTPEDSGSALASAHRVWLDLRSAVQGGDAHAILAEAERGEDHIKEKYEEAIQATAGTPVSPILHDQFASVKEGHDRVRDLRDAYKEG